MNKIAYHNDPAVKDERVKQANWHKEQGMIGIAPILSKLHDKLLEGTEQGCVEFAPRVFETLKVGADTERIAWAFIYELLGSDLVQRHVKGDDFKDQREAIEKVREVYAQALRKGVINKTAAYHAAGIAEYMADGAAYAANDASYAAANATYAASFAAVSNARVLDLVADAVREAKAAAYIQMRELLLDIQANWNVETQTYKP